MQNATGILFSIVFALVGEITFTMACVASAMVAAGLLALSINNTVGGRLFSGALFLGVIVNGALLGTAIVRNLNFGLLHPN